MKHNNDLIRLPEIFFSTLAEVDADFENHKMARTYFVELLLQRPKTRQLFYGWTEQSGLGELANQLHQSIFLAKHLRETQAPAETIRAADAISEHQRSILRMSFQKRPIGLIGISAIQYAEELKLPWFWIAGELMIAWAYELWGWANHEVVVSNYIGVEMKSPVQPLGAEAAVMPGEDELHYLKRIERLVKKRKADYGAGKKPKDRKGTRTRSPEDVKRYVGYYVKAKLDGISIEDIALEEGRDTKTVGAHIREVDRWLDAGI